MRRSKCGRKVRVNEFVLSLEQFLTQWNDSIPLESNQISYVQSGVSPEPQVICPNKFSSADKTLRADEDFVVSSEQKFASDRVAFEAIGLVQKAKMLDTESSRLGFRSSFEVIQPFVYDHDVFVDAGNTGAFVVHCLQVDGKNIFYLSLGLGGMGNSIGAGLGSCFVSRNESKKKTYVFLGDGSFLMYGLEIHTAVEHQLPIVFLIFNNNSHGMCSTREEIFLHGRSQINDFRPSYFANGLAEMFPSLRCFEVATLGDLHQAMVEVQSADGPTVISMHVQDNELPPFLTFQKIKPLEKT